MKNFPTSGFRPQRKSAFSLVEVLIAVALTGMLLTGLSLLTFQVMQAWARQADDPLFDRHVDGLRRVLEACVAETADDSNTRGARRAVNAVLTMPPGTTGASRAPYLRITGAPPFLTGDTYPMGNVRGWLVVEDGSGLVLYWQTDNERRENQDATHRQVLSPWVTSMEYKAYNASAGSWTESADADAFSSGTSIFLQLIFDHRGQTRYILLSLSDPAPHNLNY